MTTRGSVGVSQGLQASGLTFLPNWKEPGDPQPRWPPGLGPAQVGAPQARAGVGRSCPGALPTGGRAGQELQPLGGGGSSPHGVGESHVPQASPRVSSQWCRATLCTARSAGPRVAPPCGARSRPGPATGPRALGWGRKRAPSWCGAKARGAQCCGQEALWSCGAWAWWLWLERVLGGSERPSWSFLCLGPPARPQEGTLDSHRNGAGTFISGEQAGTRVGRQASGQGASPRPRSWESAGLPGS